ncbi:MAG: hypothetical protein ACKVVP_22810 [Chloroflexota bacterium]
MLSAESSVARAPHQQSNTVRIAEAVGVVLLSILAAAPRFMFPDLVPFGYDEALEALRARAIALGARPVANEVTSWLLPDPALMLYVYATVELLPDPAIARTWLLGLMNTASVLCAYLWGRSVSGCGLGFVTAIFYAVSPWAIYFGRQPWVNAQPLLTSFMLLCATRVICFRERFWILPFFLALGLQFQTHLLGALQALPAALSVLIFWRSWWRWLLPGTAVVAAINAPFAIHLWEQRDAVASTVSRVPAESLVNHPLDAPRLLAWFVGGLQLEKKLVEGASALEALSTIHDSGAILVLGLVAGIVLAANRCLRRVPGWQGYALALIWVLVPLLAAMLQSRPIYIHYMTAMVPACFLLAALPFAAALRAHRFAAISVIGLITVVSTAQIGLFAAFLQGVRLEAALPPQETGVIDRQRFLNERERDTRRVGIGDLFGTPLSYWRDMALTIQSISRERSISVITVHTGLVDPYALYVDRRRMALDYLLGTQIHARFPFEGTVVLPLQEPGLILQLPGVDLGRVLRNTERLLQVPTPGARDDTRLVALPARPLREQTLGRRSLQARFDGGIQLISYDAPQRLEPGETLALTTYWTFNELAESVRLGELSIFFHLLDQDGAIVAQSDGLGLPSHAWRSGDLLIRRVSLPVPTEPSSSRLVPTLGVYEQSTLQRTRVTLSESRIDDRVVLDSISIR